jgi:hypothetical protein
MTFLITKINFLIMHVFESFDGEVKALNTFLSESMGLV